MRRALVFVSALLLLIAAPAAPVHARASLTTADRAEIYTQVIGHRPSAIQILGRACASPRAARGCERIPDILRSQIEAGTSTPISWVHRMWPHAGIFWVLGPIRAAGGRAHLTSVWTDPSPNGCNGGSHLIFRRRTDGSWKRSGGTGWGGCP